MAIPTILKGDATNANGRTVAIHLPDEDLDGFKLRFEYLGITREFEELTRGGTVYADFSESETALFPLGTHLGTIRLGRAGRWHTVSATVPVKVSDNVGEVYGGDAANINLSIDFCGGIPDLSGIETEPTTANALARAFKALVDALKGAAGTAALIACMAAFGAPRMTVHSAPLGEVAFGNRVVTGVEFDESGLVTEYDLNITSNALANAIVGAGGFTPEMATNVARSVVKPHIDNRDNPHKVTAAQVGVYTTAEVDAKIGNAVVKDAENVVTGSFSIKRTFENHESSLSFGDYDPDGPSIVMSRLFSTAPSSFFSGSIALIPSSGEKTSMLSRIKEYSAARWDARQEVESIVSSAMMPTNPTFSNAVLAVGLNIDTNFVAVLNEIADSFGGFPIEGTATTVGGLLAALAAAVAWLKKHAKETDTRIDQIEHSSNPNMNVIGNPVFKEGSVSGFSANDYMVFPSQVSVGQSSVEFYLSFMTGIVGESQQNIIDSDKGLAFAIRNGKFVTAISVNGTDWFAEDEGDTVSSESAYEIKMTFTYEGGSYIVRTFVKDSGAWRQMGAGISASAPVHATTIYWGGANPKAANHIFLGSINLNECRMVFDGNEVWSGYDVLARNLVTYDQTKPISEQLNTAEKIASLSAYPISDLVGGALKDRTVNHATAGGTFTFPERTGTNARDFVLVIDALSEAPTVTFPGSVTYVSEQDAADIWTAEAGKVNAWYFSEQTDGVFMVCHKAMGVVAQ